MGMTSLYVIPLVCSFGTHTSPHYISKPGPPQPGGYISAEDACYLEYLLSDFLFDPKNAIRVRLRRESNAAIVTRLTFRTDDGEERLREGWLVKGRNGAPDRIYFTDGESTLASSVKFEEIDFEWLSEKTFPRKGIAYDRDSESLAIAAWLYRRGYKSLAARALAAARSTEVDPRERLRLRLAKHAFSEFRRAYFERHDQESLNHANRLSRLYPEFAAECHILPIIVEDLKRREREGTIGKPAPTSLPKEFAAWDDSRKIKYLIHALDQIGESSREIHVATLIEIGEAAVPALIDVVEHDKRLTRCTDLQIRSRFTHRRPDELVYVRDVALQLLGAILRVQHLDPYGDAIAIDCNLPAELADRFRHYWTQYGKIPFQDRMMGVLTDPNARGSARIDAAEELIDASSPGRLWWNRRSKPLRPPYASLTKYKAPSVRQAIFDAMDQELARGNKHFLNVGGVNWYVVRYISCLQDLGDPNSGPELSRRASKADSVMLRLRYVKAAHELGESGALVSFVREFGAGRIELARRPDDESLRGFEDGPFDRIVEVLVGCELREMDEALHLLADRDHPLYPLAVACALKEDFQDRWSVPSKLRHAARLVLMAQKLNDLQPTGVHYYIRGNEIEVSGEPRFRRRPYHDQSLPVGELMEHAEERVAEVFANRLSDMIIGLRPLHPLQQDVDKRLEVMKAFIDLYGRRFRPATWEEMNKWYGSVLYNSLYVPDIQSLGRPATAKDVKLGRAVFELKGRGTMAKQSLPAWLLLKTEAKSEKPNYGLVVQAETDAVGRITYGVIFRNDIRVVRSEEVERIEPYVSE